VLSSTLSHHNLAQTRRTGLCLNAVQFIKLVCMTENKQKQTFSTVIN